MVLGLLNRLHFKPPNLCAAMAVLIHKPSLNFFFGMSRLLGIEALTLRLRR
jgi:hypothetical protein